MRVVKDAVDVDAEFDVVASEPLARREVDVGESLPASGDGLRAKIEVSARGVSVYEVGLGAVRDEMSVVLVEGESGFEEKPRSEVVLVFDAGNVGVFDVLGIGELRALR